MLTSHQIRRLVLLGGFCAVCVVLLFRYSGMQVMRQRGPGAAAGPKPAAAPEEVPPPPPSRIPEGAVVLDGALRGVTDLTELRGVETEPAYRRLLDHVSSIEPAAIERESEGPVAYSTILKHAGELRGRIFHFAGLVTDWDPLRLVDPVRGREDVYRVFLMDLDRDAGFVCDLADRPPALERRQDRVEVDGAFYKVLRFENRQGQSREAPFFIARSIRIVAPPVDQEAEQAISAGKYIITGLLAAGFLAFMVIVWIQSKRDPGTGLDLRRPPGRDGNRGGRRG